ncbi:MAG: tRNA (adenosine(37)-N6)-threonylcarbamoyltransferase complex ATPase subunit type 1 TsaE [Ignavibacteriales bacterium]|nr:tRNA (adenosine(37)-N6)-threonylcarbamoyltransferase complex ATPase subunit type 1 TsaE [Ignavibacteriales bacterium]
MTSQQTHVHKQILSSSEEETQNAGKIFSLQLTGGDVVCLYGNLGSGKTRFVQGICNGLNVRQHVLSPTFTLINEYESERGTVFHFDFYRLRSTQEILQLGFSEYLEGNGICLIEWAEKAENILPDKRYDIHFQYGKEGNQRIISIERMNA